MKTFCCNYINKNNKALLTNVPAFFFHIAQGHISITESLDQ